MNLVHKLHTVNVIKKFGDSRGGTDGDARSLASARQSYKERGHRLAPTAVFCTAFAKRTLLEKKKHMGRLSYTYRLTTGIDSKCAWCGMFVFCFSPPHM